MKRLVHVLPLIIFMSASAEDAAKQALDDARRLAREGQYEDALQKHVWFHTNALSIDPSYYGVRLSFALSDWVELGKKYPHALAVLGDIRDKKTSMLLDGESDEHLFHDVSSINEYLKETSATVALFKKLENGNPAFATRLYDYVDDALIEHKEYTLAKKYLARPEERLANATVCYKHSIKSNPASRRARDQLFINEVVRLITILRETDDLQRAEHIQTEALKTLDAQEIKDALNK
jgi:hypothetical protein